uniref:Uncharacterized protein n=1 Tax=Lepeophtheirus salmonis TaxID=72036 RepID=A0A0K2URH6_LEPSM
MENVNKTRDYLYTMTSLLKVCWKSNISKVDKSVEKNACKEKGGKNTYGIIV